MRGFWRKVMGKKYLEYRDSITIKEPIYSGRFFGTIDRGAIFAPGE